jgi:hypothetical protein
MIFHCHRFVLKAVDCKKFMFLACTCACPNVILMSFGKCMVITFVPWASSVSQVCDATETILCISLPNYHFEQLYSIG